MSNGSGTDLTAFISDEMRADWLANRAELMKFWRSGECTTSETFPDSKAWLFVYGSPDTLPWAAKVFDKGGGDPKRERGAKESERTHPIA